jgi:hypothetical protein
MNGTAQLKMNEWDASVSDVRITCDEALTEQNAALAALTRRYRGRGFTRAAKEHTDDMDVRREEAREVAPAHYRWDELCANGRGDCFRGDNYLGRQVMDVDGFVEYFAECRAARRAESNETVASHTETVVPARTREQSRVARLTGTSLVPSKQRRTSKNTSDRVIAFAKNWLRPDDPALRREGKRQPIPMKAISMLVVLAVSLMLIVTSSVMVSNEKREIGDLEHEVSALATEAKLAQDKLESQLDSLDIYEIATEELGMIPQIYADSLYVESTNGNTIEVVEQPEEQTTTLATLLSAIGMDIGS